MAHHDKSSDWKKTKPWNLTWSKLHSGKWILKLTLWQPWEWCAVSQGKDRSVTHGQEDELFSLDSLESRANSFGQGWSHFPLLLTMSSRGSAIHEKLGCCLPSGQWMQGRRKQALPLIQLHPSRLTPQMCALCRGHHPCCQDDNCLNLAGPQFLLWPSPLLPEQHTHLFHLERILWRVFWG